VIYMGDVQRRKATTLLREQCANFDRVTSSCLLLSSYDYEPCPQLLTSSLICRYFRDAVLPADKLLNAQIMGESGVKGCESCGQPFRAVSNRAKFCDRCAKIRQRDQARIRMQKIRG